MAGTRGYGTPTTILLDSNIAIQCINQVQANIQRVLGTGLNDNDKAELINITSGFIANPTAELYKETLIRLQTFANVKCATDAAKKQEIEEIIKTIIEPTKTNYDKIDKLIPTSPTPLSDIEEKEKNAIVKIHSELARLSNLLPFTSDENLAANKKLAAEVSKCLSENIVNIDKNTVEKEFFERINPDLQDIIKLLDANPSLVNFNNTKIDGLIYSLQNIEGEFETQVALAGARQILEKESNRLDEAQYEWKNISKHLTLPAENSFLLNDINFLFNSYNELCIKEAKNEAIGDSLTFVKTALKKQSIDVDKLGDNNGDSRAATSKEDERKWYHTPRRLKLTRHLQPHDKIRRELSHAYKDETFAALLKKYEMNVNALKEKAIHKTPDQIIKMTNDLAVMRAGLQTLIIKSILDKTDKSGAKEKELREQINKINELINDISIVNKDYKQEAIALQHTEKNLELFGKNSTLEENLTEAKSKVAEFFNQAISTPSGDQASLASSGGSSDTKQFFKDVAKDTKVAVQINHFQHDPLIGKQKELKTASMQYLSPNEGFKTELHFETESLKILEKLKPTDKALSHWAIGSIEKQLNHPTNTSKDKLNINGIGLSKNMIKALILAAYHHNPKVQIILTNCSGVKLTDVTNKELTAFSDALTKTEKGNKNALQKNSHLKNKEDLSDKQTEELMRKITHKRRL